LHISKIIIKKEKMEYLKMKIYMLLFNSNEKLFLVLWEMSGSSSFGSVNIVKGAKLWMKKM